MNDRVILVNEHDEVLGEMEKEEAHKNGGNLHRASSVLLYRKKNGAVEVLLQKRAGTKKRWPGWWANTVCTDVRPGESYEQCAVRRLQEEMGIVVKLGDLSLAFTQIYQAQYDQEFWEHEVEAIFVGKWEGDVVPNADEVGEYTWVEWGTLQEWVRHRNDVSPWLVKMVKEWRYEW